MVALSLFLHSIVWQERSFYFSSIRSSFFGIVVYTEEQLRHTGSIVFSNFPLVHSPHFTRWSTFYEPVFISTFCLHREIQAISSIPAETFTNTDRFFSPSQGGRCAGKQQCSIGVIIHFLLLSQDCLRSHIERER